MIMKKLLLTALATLAFLTAHGQVIIPPPTDNQTAVADWSLNPAKQSIDFDGFGVSNATEFAVDSLVDSNRTRSINLRLGNIDGQWTATNLWLRADGSGVIARFADRVGGRQSSSNIVEIVRDYTSSSVGVGGAIDLHWVDGTTSKTSATYRIYATASGLIISGDVGITGSVELPMKVSVTNSIVELSGYNTAGRIGMSAPGAGLSVPGYWIGIGNTGRLTYGSDPNPENNATVLTENAGLLSIASFNDFEAYAGKVSFSNSPPALSDSLDFGMAVVSPTNITISLGNNAGGSGTNKFRIGGVLNQ